MYKIHLWRLASPGYSAGATEPRFSHKFFDPVFLLSLIQVPVQANGLMQRALIACIDEGII
jgi:hypothetical protein